MDFSYLIELAKSNDKSNKQEAAVSRFSTKVSKAKRVDKPAVKKSAVKAVLEKIEMDKHKETEEAKEKKKNLLMLRSQDKKSKKRVQAMINMSKGASKAVLDDVKDLTEAKGEEQCDEDDYGYESTMSQTIFSKLATQYAENPDTDKLKFIKNTEKRSIDEIKRSVMNTLKKEEDEENGPRKRRRRPKSNGEFEEFINDGDAYDNSGPRTCTSEKSAAPTSPKEKVVNINLTNYKSDKHNNFKYLDKEQPNEKDKKEKDKKEREKDKKEREKEREDKKEREEEKPKKHKTKPRAAPPPMSFEELLRVAQNKQKDPMRHIMEERKKVKEKEKKKELDRPLTAKEKEEQEDERRRKLKRLGKLPPEKKISVKEETSNVKNGESKQKAIDNSKLRKQLENPKPVPKEVDRSKYFSVPFAKKSSGPPESKEPKLPQFKPQPSNTKVEYSKNAKPQKPRETPREPPREMPQKNISPGKPQKFSASNERGRDRQFPPSEVRRKPPVNLPPSKLRIESDPEDEDEYDSLDDFIDDGEEEIDYRSEIGKIFGYDRSKFQDEDDDCNDMEASYSQMQMEERFTAKIGLKEDLEDIRREEEEKKRKMMRMKQMKKARR